MKILRVILSIALLAYIVVAVSWSRNQSATELCRGVVVDRLNHDLSLLKRLPVSLENCLSRR